MCALCRRYRTAQVPWFGSYAHWRRYYDRYLRSRAGRDSTTRANWKISHSWHNFFFILKKLTFTNFSCRSFSIVIGSQQLATGCLCCGTCHYVYDCIVPQKQSKQCQTVPLTQLLFQLCPRQHSHKRNLYFLPLVNDGAAVEIKLTLRVRISRAPTARANPRTSDATRRLVPAFTLARTLLS